MNAAMRRAARHSDADSRVGRSAFMPETVVARLREQDWSTGPISTV